jgi:hypothetical protein
MAMASVAMMSPVAAHGSRNLISGGGPRGRFSARAERDATSLLTLFSSFRYSLYIPCHEKS